jgi:hypothetical protein
MNAVWDYFWPMFAGGAIIGLLALTAAYRHGRRPAAGMIAGFALMLAAATIWHWPMGAADRFAATVEQNSRQVLDAYEMTMIKVHLHRKPLTRALLLAGPAEVFQSSELVRLICEVPRFRRATGTGKGGLPLIAEGMIAACAGFLLGLLAAYLLELHRRYNAQWNW